MQILTQGGGYITVHSVRSNEASFYIMVTVQGLAGLERTDGVD